MDVDPTDLLNYFDVSDDLFPWHKVRVQEIEQRRAILDDTLLFDIMLTLGGIRDPDTLYPPTDVLGLQRLLNAIVNSTYDALKKDCLVYFLLKWHRDGRERRFQRDRLIPPQLAQLAEAYWCLDAAVNVPIAVSLLSDSRLNQDYSSKILQAISTAAGVDPHPLIVKYIRTAKPLLSEPDDLDLYLVALAHHSLLEAWQFQRSFSELNPTRKRLFKKMLEWCVSPNLKAAALTHLLTMPLTPFEESILYSYASFPSTTAESSNPRPSLGLTALQNLACARLIQTGQYADAIKLHRQFSATASSTISLSSAATKMIQQRNDMIEGLYATLPSVERTLLDAEIRGTPMFSLSSANNNNTDTNMSDSWDEIPVRESSSVVHMNGIISTSRKPKVNGTTLPTPSASSTAFPTPKEVHIPSLTSTTKVPSSFSLTSSTGPVNRESLASSRSGAPRFGGAPPILPVTGSSDAGLALGSTLGFGGIPSLNTSTAHSFDNGLDQPSGRKSLLFNFAAFNSPSGAAGLSTSGTGSGSNPLLFSSSKRKPNAFYKPPFVKNTPSDNPFSIEDPAPEFGGPSRRSKFGSHSPGRPSSQNEQNRDSGGSKSLIPEDGLQNGHVLEAGAMEVDNDQRVGGLEYPLFATAGGSGPDNDIWSGRQSLVGDTSNTAPISAGNSLSLRMSQKRPPGAFTDDEDEDMVEDVPSRPPPRQTRSRKGTAPSAFTSAATIHSQPSASAKSSASASTSTRPRSKKPRQTTNASAKSKRRVPGGMSDDDDDDEGDVGQEEEDKDQVAPLAITRRTMRKTRSSTASALSPDETGPRRRSSRISVSGEAGAGGALSKRVTRKSTAGTSGKRKQR
ncbi:nuclear pore complex assembly-domain-containing protein [Lentinula aciculospora]|uniref:Nuclear pore complex assembly-domain-containing protein n=1 Tax=Lentinula aciculospora TaxID=153920 RepID=A0A9W9A3J0_9AGAR|nr:nuclear pore complex assembly-domain-containing protein [Lentinula aciculospora]